MAHPQNTADTCYLGIAEIKIKRSQGICRKWLLWIPCDRYSDLLGRFMICSDWNAIFAYRMTWLTYRWLNLAECTAQSSSQTTKTLCLLHIGHLLEPQNSLEMVSNVNVCSLLIYSVCLRVWKLLGIECSPTHYTIMASLAITLEISFSHNKAVTVYKWNHHLFMDVDIRYFSSASLVSLQMFYKVCRD